MKKQRSPRPDNAVVVVGEGLVGSLLSIFLARRGFDVEVYERRPDMRRKKISAGRSINLALSTRGLHALEQMGLGNRVLEQAIPMMGRLIHSLSGKSSFSPYGKDDSEHINSISRAWLNQVLMDEAEKTKRVRIHFKRRVTGMDFKTGTLRLGEDYRVKASVVFAADGAGSAVRRDMVKLRGYACGQEYLGHGYKELTLPAGKGDERFQLRKNVLHIWPRGSHMLIALPNFDGSFTCTLFLPFEGPFSFASLDSPEKVAAFFREQFPDVLALMPDLAGEFFAHPTGNMATVKCFPWNVAGQALLLGDAAHAMVPFYGQGMNCGFEDCTVLGESLDRVGGKVDWAGVFDDFARRRKPDTDAISEMAEENFIEMRDKVADPRFLMVKKVEKILQEKFPREYIPRYSLVAFRRAPYRLAQAAGAAQNGILSELCRDIPRAEDVDLNWALSLIREKLSPVLKAYKPILETVG